MMKKNLKKSLKIHLKTGNYEQIWEGLVSNSEESIEER